MDLATLFPPPATNLARGVLLALVTAAAGYAVVMLLYAFFLVDLR
jgi:hypothetical protein